MYKLLGVQGPTPKDVYTLLGHSGGNLGVLGGLDGHSSVRKLTPKLVTLSPPPTPKDVYKVLGVSGPTPKDVYKLLGVSRPTPKDVYTLLGA